jgi:methionine-rich copper-binding protein CopC
MNPCGRWTACVALATAAAFATAVDAHAFLDRATPAVGSTVHAPPAEIRLAFTQRLEPAFSSVRVLDASGRQVDKSDAHVDPADAALLVVSVPPLARGTYKVVWRVVSVDTHVTEGDFTFDVAP